MSALAWIRGWTGRLPTGVTVGLGFLLFVAAGAAFVSWLPPGRDARQACDAQCRPLPGHLVDDKTYPLSSKRPYYPQVCRCGSMP